MYKFILSIFITFTLLYSAYAGDVKLADSYTYSSIICEFDEANSALNSYLYEKYGIDNYRKSREFKFQVCGAQIYDCYYSKNDKYFVANIPHAEKQGDFYFGLLWNKKSKGVAHSIGQCESNYNPNTLSADGGYGIFQITPSAIGDTSIKKSQLLDDEYNTQYGLFLLSKLYKQTKQKYQQHNAENNNDFVQWLTLRGYNGGFRQIDRFFERLPDGQLGYIFTGDFIKASKINGRFVCFEKVNIVYPLKIYKTIDTINKKVF